MCQRPRVGQPPGGSGDCVRRLDALSMTCQTLAIAGVFYCVFKPGRVRLGLPSFVSGGACLGGSREGAARAPFLVGAGAASSRNGVGRTGPEIRCLTKRV